MQNGNLHLPKKFGLYQRAVDLHLGRLRKDAEWKFTFPEEVWIIPTRGGFVPMKMNKRYTREINFSRRSLDYTNVRWICTFEDEEKWKNWNLHFPKKLGSYQRVVDLYPLRWIKNEQWKFTFPEEVWIIPTHGGFVPIKMKKRCTIEIYISPWSLDYTIARWICTNEDKEKWKNWNLHFPKKFGLYQRVVDLYLRRWIKDAELKFTCTEEVWIIPTLGGFLPMKMNKRCRMEIYIYRWSSDYTNVRWICTYQEEEKMHKGN